MWYLIGLGIVLGITQVVLLVLKIETLIDWPWVLVLIPAYSAFVIAIIGGLFWLVLRYAASIQ